MSSEGHNSHGPASRLQRFELGAVASFQLVKRRASRVPLRAESDARLVALTCQAQREAFDAIVERYWGPLFRYCRRLVPDSRAEDAVQQTLFKAWIVLRAGNHIEDLRPWLYRIARNAAIDLVRHMRYEHELLRGPAGPVASPVQEGSDAEAERRMQVRRILFAINALPQRQREALLQTVISGKSHQEVADGLGLKEGAVRQLVRRARAALRHAHGRRTGHARHLTKHDPQPWQ